MIRKHPKQEIRRGVQNTSLTSPGTHGRWAWPLIFKSGHAQRGVYLQSHEPKILEQVRLLYLAFIQSASGQALYLSVSQAGFWRPPLACIVHCTNISTVF